MISALRHYAYCARSCGLIHIEAIFHENVFTLKGRVTHERAHEGPSSTEGGVRVERGLPLWSERLGLTGVADIVEIHADGRIYPVEYKRTGARLGPRGRRPDDVQLCAQALCLEEMFGLQVLVGAIYSDRSRRRREVQLNGELRGETELAIGAVREMVRSGCLSPPADDERCPNCSLIDACLPSAGRSAARRAARELWRLPLIRDAAT